MADELTQSDGNKSGTSKQTASKKDEKKADQKKNAGVESAQAGVRSGGGKDDAEVSGKKSGSESESVTGGGEASEREKDKKDKRKPAPEAVKSEVASENAPAPRRVKGKTLQQVSVGIAHINATFNNTHVTITDRKGCVIAWSSGGRLGFSGTKKSSAYAATMVAQDAARQAAAYRLNEVEVRVQGPGAGRESAIRALQSAGLTVSAIRDVTPVPHNGCRPRKRRRV